MFTKLSQILPKTINRQGLRGTVNAAVVCAKYAKVAPEIIHKDALEHTHSRVYKGGTLIVAVRNSAWSQQVTERSEALIKAINEHLGNDMVKKVQTRVIEDMNSR